MWTRLLLISMVLVQSLAAPSSSSDLQTAETKWKGHVGGGPSLYRGPALYGPGPRYGGWSPYVASGQGWPGVGFGRFAGGYGPGFYDDPLVPFSFGAFPGGVDPWGLGYSGFGPWNY